MTWGKWAAVPIAASIALIAGCSAAPAPEPTVDNAAACTQALDVLAQARGSMELIQRGDSASKIRVHLETAIERAAGLAEIEASGDVKGAIDALHATYNRSVGVLLDSLDGGSGDTQKAQAELMESILDLDEVCR